jgi:hypothetical protein
MNLVNIMTLLVRLDSCLSTNIQVIDLSICPSLPRFVVMPMLTDVRGSPPQNAAFAKSVHDAIYERVRSLANWRCPVIPSDRRCADRDHVQSFYHPRKPSRIESP